MLEEVGVKVINLYMIKNNTTKSFTGLAKVVVLGNKILDKWMTEKRENLGG